jgi:hypothetical protein
MTSFEKYLTIMQLNIHGITAIVFSIVMYRRNLFVFNWSTLTYYTGYILVYVFTTFILSFWYSANLNSVVKPFKRTVEQYKLTSSDSREYTNYVNDIKTYWDICAEKVRINVGATVEVTLKTVYPHQIVGLARSYGDTLPFLSTLDIEEFVNTINNDKDLIEYFDSMISRQKDSHIFALLRMFNDFNPYFFSRLRKNENHFVKWLPITYPLMLVFLYAKKMSGKLYFGILPRT